MKLKVLVNDFRDSTVCQSLSLSGEIGRIVDFVETPDVKRAMENGIFEPVEESKPFVNQTDNKEAKNTRRK